MRKSFGAVAAVLAATVLLGAGAASASGQHAVSGLDVSWLKTSAQGDVFEIRGGKIALQKTSNAAVKALAQRLISDHSKSLKDAEKLARRYGIKLEKKPTPSQKWELSIVSSLTGKAFDVQYSKLEVLDHQQDISETSDEARMGSNSEIVKDARKEIPMLRLHLRLSKQAYASSTGES